MWDTHLDLCHASLRCLSNLAEVQGIEPSTLRWRGFQDRLSTLLAYLQNLVRVTTLPLATVSSWRVT